jgi:hypothetical protein
MRSKLPCRIVLLCFIVASLLNMRALGALNPSLSPGGNFNLSDFKLQLPVASGSGVLEIDQPQLATYTSSFFYTASDGAMTFWTPVTGATTSGSSYPRSELRDLREWAVTSTKTQTGTVKILQQPSTGKIIFAQIHGHVSGSELLKLRWTNGEVRAGVKTSIGASEAQQVIKSGLSLGTEINYTIRMSNRVLTVTVNGTTVSYTMASNWDQDTVYFKAGCYIEDNAGTSSEGGKVAYYALNGPALAPAAPIFNPAPGTYTSPQNVTITTSTSGASIRYTLDGSTPTTSSTLFSGPINVATTKTLKAIAVVSSEVSGVTSGTYTINSGGGALPLIFEAESSSFSSTYWSKMSSSPASGGFAMKALTASLTSAPSGGSLTYTFSLNASTSIYLQVKSRSPNTTASDSIWIRIDGGTWQQMSLNSTTTYLWTPLSIGTVAAGSHSFEIRNREANCAIDQVAITITSAAPN